LRPDDLLSNRYDSATISKPPARHRTPPYRDGNWVLDDPYGLTWVSNEPWGYAPYHYGRWVSADDRWYWVPDAANTQPAYAPALVAFLPSAGANEIGWVPLAPGEQYAPASYDANWQPHYAGDNYYAPERVVNMGAPNGVTVVSVEDFGRPVDRRSLARFDPRAFEGTRPVLEPFSNALLRQASLKHAAERRGFELPPGLAKKLDSTRVYASAPPPSSRDDLARRFRVEPVPEKQKHEKLKFDDERRQPLQVAAPAVRGFEEGRGRPRVNRGEQKAQERTARVRDFGNFGNFGNFGQRPVSPEHPQAERAAAGRAEAVARGERAAQARQQAQAAREQQRAAEQQRFEARRQSEANAQAQRQAAQQQRAQQAAAQRAQQMESMRARQSQQQQRHAERQQQQPQQRPAMQAPPGQARRQQQGPADGPPSEGGRGQGQGNGGGGGGGGKGKGKH
jgi:hypothetical protein